MKIMNAGWTLSYAFFPDSNEQDDIIASLIFNHRIEHFKRRILHL